MGSGWCIIDSSIWVAVITVHPLSRAERMMSFCSSGTSGAPISTPRSPRATITASDTWTIASRSSIASAFSILAITRAVDPAAATRSHSSATSSARRTNDSAT